jgi:hypothetical protein
MCLFVAVLAVFPAAWRASQGAAAYLKFIAWRRNRQSGSVYSGMCLAGQKTGDHCAQRPCYNMPAAAAAVPKRVALCMCVRTTSGSCC